jgi:hypothetical protein
MIWVSALWLFFSRNLLDRAGEKILLTHPVNRGGDYRGTIGRPKSSSIQASENAAEKLKLLSRSRMAEFARRSRQSQIESTWANWNVRLTLRKT